MKVKHILVAMADPGTRSSAALAKASAIARKMGAELTLFHSLYSPYVAGEQFYSPDALEKDIEGAVNARKAQLAKLAGPLEKSGITVRVRVRWDYPVYESIVREAVREDVDLVVAESHRHTRAARVVLSNTDWQLIRLCPCPVLFVKTAKPYDRVRVLAAVDPLHAHAKPEQLDRTILAEARDLAETFNGSMHAVHAYLLATPFTSGVLMEPVPLPVNVAEQHLAEVRQAFEKLVKPYALGPRRTHLRAGNAAVEIPAVAEEVGAGVVVMGAVSRSGLKRLFIGSTAERVIDHLACDVMVIKPEGFKTPVPRRPGYRPVVLPPL
jgi:universal stress protein E